MANEDTAESSDTATPGIEVQPGVKPFSEDQSRLWKRRYETSCDWWDKSDHKDRCERVVRYLHNDFNFGKDSEEVFFNQFFISLKTLIPLVIANNPFVAVTPENDIVFEYDKNGMPKRDPMTGEVIRHNITKTAETIQGLLKNRLQRVIDFKAEMRQFLRNSITFNRGIFVVGHTKNSEYSGSFNKPTFHAFIKSLSPRKVKRQAGTTTIDEGTYCFYEYELPVSHLKKDASYNLVLLEQCTQEILEDVKIGKDDDSQKDYKSGRYDDVKFIKLRTAYDFLTGDQFVFGKGCNQPLKVIKPDYSFKNPFTEFIPNETFQPDQTEPKSDLMMVENIVKKAQKVIKKSIRHIENFNTGYNVEENTLDDNKKKRIDRSNDRDFWVFKANALSGGKVQPRNDVQMGQEPFNLIQFLFDFVEKTLAVYNFQQGGGAGQDETATKTQVKFQTSQTKSGDMSDMFRDACNKGLNKYLEVLIKTTDTKEVIQCIGDAGEVEYRPFDGNEAKRGQYYCDIDVQSMGKNDDVKTQQRLKFYEIIKTDQDPAIQQKFDKLKLVEKIAESLRLGQEGIIRKTPDTQGMDEQNYREYLKQQMLKARKESEQAVAGAEPLPPTPDDDDDIHLADHLGEAQKWKAQAATNPDPSFQQKAQLIIQSLLAHAQPHIDRKRQKEAIDSRMAGTHGNPSMMGAPTHQATQIPVANQPPNPGQMLGQAQTVGGMQ